MTMASQLPTIPARLPRMVKPYPAETDLVLSGPARAR